CAPAIGEEEATVHRHRQNMIEAVAAQAATVRTCRRGHCELPRNAPSLAGGKRSRNRLDRTPAPPFLGRGQPAKGGVEEAAAQQRFQVGETLISRALEVLQREAKLAISCMELLRPGLGGKLRPELRQLPGYLGTVDTV